MSRRDHYTPGEAKGARVEKGPDQWTLVLVRDFRHPPERVWEAITEPEHLTAWAPFDASGSLGKVGTVSLSTVGTPGPMVAETKVRRAERPKLLEYSWGAQDLRWELEPHGPGTRLTLWHNIDRRFVAWGAAGWHICFDVLDAHLEGESDLAAWSDPRR